VSIAEFVVNSAFIIGVVVICAALLWWRFYWPPRVLGTIANVTDTVVIHLRYRSINSLVALTVWSWPNGRLLWSCDLGRRLPTDVVYGSIPEGGTQHFPNDGTPDVLRPGEQAVVEIVYQYDYFVACCVGAVRYLVKVPESGKARRLSVNDSQLVRDVGRTS
jgi:hypothetical protein